jgi:hypothetical protein
MKNVAATKGQRVNLAMLFLEAGRTRGVSWAGTDIVLNLCAALLARPSFSPHRSPERVRLAQNTEFCAARKKKLHGKKMAG